MESTTNSSMSLSEHQPRDMFLISDALYVDIMSACRFILLAITSFGCLSNVANILVFYKMKLNTSANVCFFSLAVADFLSLGWIFVLFLRSFIDDSRALISYRTVVTALLSQIGYGSFVCGSWITTIISMERCCAVVYPLKVKQIFTLRTITILIFLMFTYEIVASIPYFFSFRLIPVTSPDTNWTMLISSDQKRGLSTLAMFISFSVPMIICFAMVLVGTIFLINSFHKSIRLREQMSGSRSEKLTAKDARVIKSVIFVCVLYIMGYALDVFKFVGSIFYPQLHIYDPYLGNFAAVWTAMAYIIQAVSCSANIFVYLKLNSTYREIFQKLVLCT